MREHLIDSLKVLVPNGVTIGLVTLTQIDLLLKLALMAATLVYTVTKIVRTVQEIRDHKG